MALPKGVKSPVDYTKLYMSNELDGESINEKKQEPKLPKINKNVKSMNMMSFKPGESIGSIIAKYGDRGKGMISRLMGGISDPEVDKDVEKTLRNTNKKTLKKSSYGKAFTDFKKGGPPPRAKGLAKLGKGIVKGISKTPKGALVAG